MHGPEFHQRESVCRRGWIWLLAGTGDGPPLAEALLRQGWRLRVQVVTAEAARAYPPHPHLEVVAAGPLEPAAIAVELERRYGAVVDATHPFALRISAALEAACQRRGQRLLRLERRLPGRGPGQLLAGLEDLARLDLAGERLLLAIGARQLGTAIAASPGALHHARLLPRPEALRQALAAGLAPQRLACVHPSASGWIEAGLVRHWAIATVVVRQGGGRSEALWQRLAERLPLRLLLIQQPRTHGAAPCLPAAELLRQLAALR